MSFMCNYEIEVKNVAYGENIEYVTCSSHRAINGQESMGGGKDDSLFILETKKILLRKY